MMFNIPHNSNKILITTILQGDSLKQEPSARYADHVTSEICRPQYVIQQGDYVQVIPVVLRLNLFGKGYNTHICQNWHHQTLFCWSYNKDNAYHKNLYNLDELETKIFSIIADISPMAMQAVCTNMLCHAQLCMQYTGAFFQNFCNKMYYKCLTLNKVFT